MSENRKTVVILLAIGLLLASALAAGGPDHDGIAMAQGKGLIVRVLLFSGRPDPTYELADPQMIEKLKAGIAGAKRLDGFDKVSVIPANIGYKGILVDNTEKREGIPARFAVYKGNMELMDGQKRFAEDKGGAIETMLMDEAIRRGLIDETILRRMKKN